MPEMSEERKQSELTSDGHMPNCCFWDPANGHGARLYAAYNAAGPSPQGLNYQGKPCPEWRDLPQAIRDKWDAVAAEAGCAG